MAENGPTAVSLLASPNHKDASLFSSFRVRFADRPSSALIPANNYEIDEDDGVVWSADVFSDVSSVDGDSPYSVHYESDGSDSSPIFPSDLRHRSFQTERYGLSAALSEDRGLPVNQRRQAINVPGRRAVEADASKICHQSAPMNIPAWPRGRRLPSRAFMDASDEDDGDDAADMLPPHVIVARSHVMTFSVFEGVGRTLKGRDLRRVRNAVFQKTGFLD